MSRAYSPAPSQGYAPLTLGPLPGSGQNTPSRPASRNMLHQSPASRAPSQYLDMSFPPASAPMMGHESGEHSPSGGNGPSDYELDRAVQDILRDADLNTVTKREVRRKLEDKYGMDLSTRKATINAVIDRILLGQ